MSIWDSVKPAARVPVATSMRVSEDGQTVSLGWNDGVASSVPSRRLRQLCPCAECVEEWSGKRTYDIETIPPDMKVIEVPPVGNYALAFTFADLHRTGIFTWSYLRELGEHRSA